MDRKQCIHVFEITRRNALFAPGGMRSAGSTKNMKKNKMSLTTELDLTRDALRK